MHTHRHTHTHTHTHIYIYIHMIHTYRWILSLSAHSSPLCIFVCLCVRGGVCVCVCEHVSLSWQHKDWLQSYPLNLQFWPPPPCVLVKCSTRELHRERGEKDLTGESFRPVNYRIFSASAGRESYTVQLSCCCMFRNALPRDICTGRSCSFFLNRRHFANFSLPPDWIFAVDGK